MMICVENANPKRSIGETPSGGSDDKEVAIRAKHPEAVIVPRLGDLFCRRLFPPAVSLVLSCLSLVYIPQSSWHPQLRFW